jgi:hypothetical protein
LTFLCGVAAAEVLLIAVFALLLRQLTRLTWMKRAVPVAAAMLLTAGLVWFFVRSLK